MGLELADSYVTMQESFLEDEGVASVVRFFSGSDRWILFSRTHRQSGRRLRGATIRGSAPKGGQRVGGGTSGSISSNAEAGLGARPDGQRGFGHVAVE